MHLELLLSYFLCFVIFVRSLKTHFLALFDNIFLLFFNFNSKLQKNIHIFGRFKNPESCFFLPSKVCFRKKGFIVISWDKHYGRGSKSKTLFNSICIRNRLYVGRTPCTGSSSQGYYPFSESLEVQGSTFYVDIRRKQVFHLKIFF